jgi:hypothetical protein
MVRSNRHGLTFVLEPSPSGGTCIELRLKSGTKKIIVASPIQEMNQGWYNWEHKGMFVQDAFHFLSPDEREFLQTGMTPQEFEVTAKAFEDMADD